MLKNFSKLDVRNQILLLLGLMGLIMVIFSGIVVYGHGLSYFQNSKLENIVKFSVKSSAFVHELQKERGMTAGFINSNGSKFALELPKQREVTDNKKEDLVAFIEVSGVDNMSKYLSKTIDKAILDSSRIDSIRSQVDALSIAPKDAIGFYTSLNNDLISAIASGEHESENPEILLQIASFVAFLNAKERAGIERAVGAVGFGASFSINDIAKLNSLITIQNVYFNVFKSYALSEQVKFFQSALNDNSAKEVERMRGIARASISGGLDTSDASNKVYASYWFKTITKKINILKSIEDRLSQDLLVNVEHEKDVSFRSLLIWGLLVLTVIIIVSYLARGFIIGLNDCFDALKGCMIRGASGDFSTRITYIKSEGEMKHVQDLANSFMDQTDVFIREAAASMEAVSQGKYYRKILTKGFNGIYLDSANAINNAAITAETKADELQELMKQLEETVKSVVSDTSFIANNMKEASSLMLSSSTNSVTKSDEVEGAASVAQDGASTVAAAVEEMSASIGEISSQTTNSLQIVNEAQSEIREVSDKVEKFGEEVEGISSVVELIKDIAEQTNLLALNATIEAARAGDAGKGFAVVASEVKGLAGQTASATEQITSQITAIQNGSNDIVVGIESISVIMEKVSEISNAISASVEEQRSATQEISGNMQRTSQNVDEVKGNIISIKAALEETVTSASSMSEMTENVSSNIVELDEALERVINKEV